MTHQTFWTINRIANTCKRVRSQTSPKNYDSDPMTIDTVMLGAVLMAVAVPVLWAMLSSPGPSPGI